MPFNRGIKVVHGAGRDSSDEQVFCGASARKCSNLVFKLLLCQQVFVALVDLHRIAECAGGAGDYRYLLHGRRVRLHRRDERVTYLVISDNFLFAVREHRVLLLISRDDRLNALFEVGFVDDGSVVSDRA